MGDNRGFTVLPDGSAFGVLTLPLPDDHWLTAKHDNVPPMPLRCGTDDPNRKQWVDAIREIGRYALRCSTINGTDDDIDPDALLQNMIVAALGYWTPNGLSSEQWQNPLSEYPALPVLGCQTKKDNK